jgi:hypothetical protein
MLILLPGAVQANLIQHLDATVPGSVTDNPVSQWTDQTSYSNDATIGIGSVYYPSSSLSESELAGLDFGSTRNSLELFTASESDSWLDQSSGSGFCVLIAFKSDGLLGSWSDLIGNSSAVSAGFGLRYGIAGDIQAYLGGVTIQKSTAPKVTTGDTIIYAFNYDVSDGSYEFWDSKNNSSMTGSVTAGDFSLSNAVTLGSMTNSGRYLNGMVGEVKIYDAALSASQFQSERDWLAQKWVDAPTVGSGNRDGDVDGDGYVDGDDLALFADAWLDFDCASDANFDELCSVDYRDFALLASSWLTGDDLEYGAYYGYQGWHFATGDGRVENNKWVHWFEGNIDDALNIHGDMWPDLREYDQTNLYPTQMQYADGSTAKLYSAFDYSTIDLHVKWMKDYGITGCVVQRFTSIIDTASKLEQGDKKIQSIITACEKYGIKFWVMHDSGKGDANEFARITNDWKHLVDDLGILDSPSYAYQNGLPAYGLWGIGVTDRDWTPETVLQILDFYQTGAPKYQAYVCGGVPVTWHDNTPAGWGPVFDRLDMVSPWRTVFNPTTNNIARMNDDLVYCNANGLDYNPVVSPGASTLHLRDDPAMFNWKPRNGGHHLWQQVYEVCKMGSKFMYVAMFDEVDEGTAMYKLAEIEADLPVGAEQAPLDIDGYALPSDWYLRVGTEMQKMLDGRIALTDVLPLDPDNP